ncbi:MAG: hypothetical protein ABI889_04385 [Gemmatimonadota bacterium]
MSDQLTAVEPTSRSVAILGVDALLVALPSTPTQLANACFAGGYDDVIPATWGDELIAGGCLAQLEHRTGPAIFCACPLVAEQLRGAQELRRFIVPLVSPPVAVARHLRSLNPEDTLRITYVGDCPGADDAAIDARLSPHELLRTLAKSGIFPASQRPELGEHPAHDRRRFYSLPGGVPSEKWLGAQWPKRTLVDAHAGDALAGLANQTLSRGNTLIDFAPQLGCACAGAVSGTDAQNARNAVIALEPPRSETEIVIAAEHVEVSLAIAGDHHDADVTWGDFLAALPAALAMHPEDATAPRVTRESSCTAPRRALLKKAALPRAYMAARSGLRRDRNATRREGSTQPIAALQHERQESAAESAMAGPTAAGSGADYARRAEITSARPNQWVARRATQEGMTGPRAASMQRAGLATADRWLLSGLMLTSSVLIAVLTSALTVRGMQRADTSVIVSSARSVAAGTSTPVVPTADTVVARAVAARADSAVAAVTVHADTTPNHEVATGAVAPPPPATRISPLPVARVRQPKNESLRAARHAVSIAEHVGAQPAIAPPPTITSPSTPASSGGVPPATAAPSTTAQSTPAPAATNAQFLEELRAIHAEIDARKHHMDSLTASLDSLKHVSKPE